MQKQINLGNEKAAIETLEQIKSGENNYDVRITNSHITKLNNILGKRVFKKDVVYVNSQTLIEIMKPIGGKGQHHFHGLTSKNIFDALRTMKDSTDIRVSYGERYIIVTLATVFDNINVAVIVTPKGTIKADTKHNVTRIITLYPYNKNKC